MILKRNLLSASVALVIANGAVAQEPVLEEVVVVGIRGSLMQSVDRKRDAQGVVDAITSEDMGKFPDSNLAESLQRITGVSIDRSNGEGSKITVRGMGPDFNLVTLNGRQMPTTGGRSFDFADIASESVKAVEVHKTSKAYLPTGGIGATVNVITPRPMDDPGFKAVLSGKAVHETSVENGDDVTPEIAGLFSNTFADDTFGVLVSGSYQDRNNQEQSAAVNNWIPNVSLGPTASVKDNNQRADGATWYPQNAGYNIKDKSRERVNAQLVLQWEPSEDFTATLDYTYSKVENESENNGFGVWFNNGGSTTAASINKRGTYTRVEEAGGDYATNVGTTPTEKENKSLGINLVWHATDTLTFEFDAHDSSANFEHTGIGDTSPLIGNSSFSDPDFPEGATQTANIDRKSAVFGSSGIPVWDLSLVDGFGNPQGELTGSDMGSLFAGSHKDHDENDMTQLQLSGSWKNEGAGALTSIDFGMAYTEQEFRSRKYDSGQLPAGWWGYSADYWDDALWQRESTRGILDEFSGGGNISVPYYMTAGFGAIRNGYETIGQGPDEPWGCCYAYYWGDDYYDAEAGRGRINPGPLDSDAQVNEQVTSLYAQLNFNDEFNGMDYSLAAGLRYEESEVKSKGLELEATNVVWVGGNEFSYEFADEQSYSSGDGKSEEWLPSIDFSLNVTEDLITRVSFSRSLARPDIGAMGSTATFDGNPKVGQRKVTAGNPDLEPYLSDNFDLSVEYYYGEGSYVSVGYFKKIVDNFLVNTTIQTPVNDLKDVYTGPRAVQARIELESEGTQATDPATFDRVNENMGAAPNSPIYANGADPLIMFDVSRDENAETGELYGWELAVQHMFGESGWGVLANATLVDGDIEADRYVTDVQFALPGMSDSANLSVFYENDWLSARVSYNWRDEFLAGFDQHSSPEFFEEYDQVDVNVSYFVNDNFSVFFEALNVTEEVQRKYVRYEEQLVVANQYGARYNLGMRYVF